MFFLLRLSFKNLTRYMKRTLITASAIGFGLGLFLFVDSMLIGAERDSERNLIWYETASMRIYDKQNIDQYQKLNLKNLIEQPDVIMSALEKQNLTKRVLFSGELIVRQNPFPEDGSMNVQVSAIDPKTDSNVYRIEESIEPGGSWLTPNTNGLLLGAWIAQDLQAKVGYPLTIVTRTKDGAFQTLDMEVVGIVNTANPIINRYSVMIDLQYADQMLGLNGAVTQIDLAYGLSENVEQLKPKIEEMLTPHLQEVGVLSWRDLAKSYLSLVSSKKSGSSAILGLVFLISLVGITNTMLLAMFERRKELGMLRALGLSHNEIRLLFMFEAGGIGIIGGLAGVFFGTILVWFIVNIGIDYSFLLRDMDVGYRLTSVFRGIWRPQMFVIAFLMSIIFSMLVALIPVRQSLKMSITDCLGGDKQ